MHLNKIFLFSLSIVILAFIFCNIVPLFSLYSITQNKKQIIQQHNFNVIQKFINKTNNICVFFENNKNQLFIECIDFYQNIDPLILILMVIF